MHACVQRLRDFPVLAALLTLILSGSAFAAITGKVSGTVTDSDGIPLPGAAVTVVDTRLGATTDSDGLYVILQVPPGSHDVIAHLIGFNTTTVTGVRVNADLTSRVDFQLVEEAIEVGAITVTAERPPIEADVTGSQTIVDAERVSEVPVNQMLDVLHYQPGVTVARDNELEIRGGGPSEIRFQVDGLDRSDGVTSKSYTQLNQMLVSEVTLLTGGFNAEYGNVRSGMVNVVVKEGTERGGALPWVAGVANYAPAQRKHFGPGAYDEDQYDYWTLTKTDSALSGGPVLWPDLYEQTRTDTAFMNLVHDSPTRYKVFDGWDYRTTLMNAKRIGRNSAYGHIGWEPQDLMEAWMYEANMNEVAWQYGHEPDWGTDLAAGWALPNRMGGLVLGYSYNKEMTAVPAVRPSYFDESIEGKLTLTPIDRLKIQLRYTSARNQQPGTSASGPEETDTGAGTQHADPTAVRSTGTLYNSISGRGASNNKLNLSELGLLDGSFSQWGASITYTFGANTYVTVSGGRTESTWDLYRNVPRADMMDPDHWPDEARYSPPDAFDYPGLLGQWFSLKGDYTTPPNLDFATNPDSLYFKSPYDPGRIYGEIPTETRFVTKTFTWGPRDYVPARGDAVYDTTYTVTVVSPQGKSIYPYSDLSGIYPLGGGWGVEMDASAVQTNLRGDITHNMGRHTMKAGMEFSGRDIEFDYRSESNSRSYGGAFPAALPKYLGTYVQDEYESDGMVANFGMRLERFDSGHPAFMYGDLFNQTVFGTSNSLDIYKQIVIDLGWDVAEWGIPGNPDNHYYATNDSLMKYFGVPAPLPADVVRAWPQQDNEVYWRLAPRFGISHPISNQAKFFFNYGIFYSMQKPVQMFGFASHNSRPGAIGRMEDVFNPNLRPARTAMYEVGLEQLLPFRVLFRATTFAKYNTDQVSRIEVRGQGFERYWILRNSNYEDVFGYELTLARGGGRFVNGSITYERSSSRTGETGYDIISDNVNGFSTGPSPFARTTRPEGFLRAILVLGTPGDWGMWTRDWSLSLVQEWRKGGEVLYNPDAVPERELPDENRLPKVDHYNADVKILRRVRFGGASYVSFYMDIQNVFNIKRLRSTPGDYLAQVYALRISGRQVKVGDESTFAWMTEPYKAPNSNSWNQPISPHTEWAHYLNPRYYRFGMRFEF